MRRNKGGGEEKKMEERNRRKRETNEDGQELMEGLRKREEERGKVRGNKWKDDREAKGRKWRRKEVG